MDGQPVNANRCGRGPPVPEVAGRSGRPAMGFNLQGMGLGAAAMLHLLLLAVFIVVFFWLPTFGPAAGFVVSTENFARNMGYTVLSAMESQCQGKPPQADTDVSSLKQQLKTFLAQVEAEDEKSTKQNNKKLLIVSCSSVGVIFVIMIILIILAKVRCHKVDWGRMMAYCFGVFVLFCGFELALFFVIIQQYIPLSNQELGNTYINRLRTELLAMQQAGYIPRRKVEAQVPDLFHPVLMYALSQMSGLSDAVGQLDRFLNRPPPPSASS
jgi:hypothetical protein